MRVLEFLLLTGNFLSLLLSFTKASKAFGLGLAGINLLVLLLHGMTEGFRYQMAFSYLFVLVFAICAAIQMRGKFSKVKFPKALKVIAAIPIFALIALTGFLASALPVFTLPPLTGSYAVGVKYLVLVDENRPDPFLAKSTQKRRLMLKVYYPAKPDEAKPFVPYFHGSTPLMQSLAAFYQMPSFLFDHFRLVQTHSKEDLEVSSEQVHYPVVLFSNGAGTTMEVETSQSEDLASHGYIVIAIDHPYVSAAVVFPDRIVTAHEATTNFDTPEPAEPITQIMADDAKFVLDTLAKMNTGSIVSVFKGKLNLGTVGFMGHSVGGATAYNMAINDSRVKAAINLDGAVYVIPKDTRKVAPFLMLANDKFHVQALESRKNLMKQYDESEESQKEIREMYGSRQAYEAQYRKAQQCITQLTEVLEASGNLYTITGSDHMKFTDMGLFIGNAWLRELLQIGGKTAPKRCLEITQAITATFFDHHLKGKTSETLEALTRTYPELRKVNLH